MTLTRYKSGSFLELVSLAFPLMLSSLSIMAMFFVDRLMLAHYSTEALNAAVTASTYGWAFVASWMVLASIAEVFVAQYNGAGSKEKIGEPVWQMVWLSLLSSLFFIPFAFYGGVVFWEKKSIAQEYFFWMMLFGPSVPLYGALCGFFVGRGKMFLITVLAFLTNGINAFLDYALIFGIEGWIPSLGARGAAIATSGSSLFQAFILLFIFLSKSNRAEFGTGNWAFKLHSFLKCLKVGFPNALFVCIEVLGFAVYYALMAMMGEKYITIAGICQAVIILLYFFAEGVSKAATTVAGNLIGGKKISLISGVLKSGIKMHFLFLFIALILFFFFSDNLLHQFLPDLAEEKYLIYHEALSIGLFCMTFYLFFEGIRLLFSGLLTAAGDTIFLCWAGSLSVWIFLVLPIYLIVVLGKASVEVSCILFVTYSAICCVIYYTRYKSGKWKEITLISAS